MKGTNIARPWWWWLNPWLYIKRRDEAYYEVLDELKQMNVERWRRQQLAKGAGNGEA